MSTNLGDLDSILAQKTVPSDQNVAILAGIDSSGNTLPIAIEDVTGKLLIAGVTIDAGDIQIGAVEIKDADVDVRVKVKSDGAENAVVVLENSGTSLTVPKFDVLNTSAGLVLASNTSRKSFSIQVIGANTVFIAKTAAELADTATGGWPVLAGGTFSDSTYNGDVFAKAVTATSEIRIFNVVA